MGADQFYELINGENRFRILTSMMDKKHFAVGYEIWERYHDRLGNKDKLRRFEIKLGDCPQVL